MSLKTFFITGAASGIGRATSRYLLKTGYNVFMTDAQLDMLQVTCDKVFKADLNAEQYSHMAYALMDITSDEQVKDAVENCMVRFGRLDVLVNNAGKGSRYNRVGPRMDQIPTMDFANIVSTNLTGTYRVSQACIPHLECSPAGTSTIINISSCRAHQSEAHCESYAATKAGLVGLTHAMALSLGPKIKVHCLSPGWIDVRFERKPPGPNDNKEKLGHKANSGWAPSWGHGLREIDHAQHPVGRVGKGEDIAAWIEFLGVKEPGFCTGQEIIVDGGYNKKLHYA